MSSVHAPVAVSVVVVAYRQREPLADCLRSCALAGEAVGGTVEIIVVDNGGLADFVRGVGVSVELIEPHRNLGFAGGVSAGLQRARGEWIALVNDDARLEHEALVAMLEAGKRDASIGSIAAQIRFEADPRRINSAGIVVDRLGIAAERLAGRDESAAQDAVAVFGPSGCVALYRRSMLDALGGFEERFFAYLEDVDLAWRAQAAGWTSKYEPRAVAYHRASASSGEGSARKYELVGRNRVMLLARNATAPQLVRAAPGILVYDAAYVLYAGIRHRTLAPLRGRVAGLRLWRCARAETDATRQPVTLDPAWHGWLAALRQHIAYLRLGARG